MSTAPVLIVGAGLSGLSAAVVLAQKGMRVEVFEAAGFAGGRCRSYYDAALGEIIDNGNHLILSGNGAVRDYLVTIGSARNFAGPPRAEFAFADLRSGARWTIRPNAGPIPWWVLKKGRRVPGTSAGDYGAIRKLMRDGRADRMRGPLWERLLQPVLVAALNTDPAVAAPNLIATILRETLAKGGLAIRPRVAMPTLGAAFVDPAVDFIMRHGGKVRFGERLRAIRFDGDRVAALDFGGASVPVPGTVIVALPPWAAASLVPGLETPDKFRGIVSVHYRIAPPADAPAILGLIGGTAEWIFSFPNRVSVTISDADRLIDDEREDLARRCWTDVQTALQLPGDLPAWQVVKEKRATFAATEAQEKKRPQAATRWSNLVLAGDWTATGLPATIEGAVRSGQRAAQLVLQRAPKLESVRIRDAA